MDPIEEESDMDRSIVRGALSVTVAAAATLAMLAPQASATAKNVNFLGTWNTDNNQPFTIKTENRKTGVCSGTTSLSKMGPYKLVACHVNGNKYAFTITYGAGYKSYNKGTITANMLTGKFRDTNGSTGIYSAVRA
jgi:hypothetical protein